MKKELTKQNTNTESEIKLCGNIVNSLLLRQSREPSVRYVLSDALMGVNGKPVAICSVKVLGFPDSHS